MAETAFGLQNSQPLPADLNPAVRFAGADEDSADTTEFRRPQLNRTTTLPKPNDYAVALETELKHIAFSEERAPKNKSFWRQNIFQVSKNTPMDIEIGTGNGVHFRHHAHKHPERCLVGLELKYKPLVQTIRGALRLGCKNVAICRHHAMNIDELFELGEIDNVFIHFPDPWVSPRKPSNRFVNERVLKILWELQKPGSQIEFKTDSREYFLWSLLEIARTPYVIEFQTLDLHNSEAASGNVITTFERIFMRKNIPINLVRLRKPL